MMLEKSLDVLRSKELSFWCILNVKFYDNEEHKELWTHTCCVLNNHKFAVFSDLLNYKNKLYWLWEFNKEDEWIEIIWHPLNRWRLYHLCHWRKPAYLEMGEPEYDHAEYNKFYLCFENIKDIFYTIWFDKTEIERMQHYRWDELYPLLVEFSSYFNR